MAEEKSHEKMDKDRAVNDTSEFEVDVSFEDDDASESQEAPDISEEELKPPIPEEWKGKPESEIALLQKMQELQIQLNSKEEMWVDKYARLQAEFDNYCKRNVKEKDKYYSYASAELIAKLLPVLDSTDNMLKSLKQKLEPDDYKGIQMFFDQLFGVLKKEGLAPIKTKGETFDPFIHEILTLNFTDEYPEDTIIEEFQKGYRFKDRVLRPSKVVIAKPKKVEENKTDSKELEINEESKA